MKISEYIQSVNQQGGKILSVYLTAGYPNPEKFTELALGILDSGADMLEIGVPFSDPLADGPIIQDSSTAAIAMGISVQHVLDYVADIKKSTLKPVLIMTYMNPLIRYGFDSFIESYNKSGADGLIIPDIIPEEFPLFAALENKEDILCSFLSPTTSIERILSTDKKKWAFLYYVSMLGTTGKLGAYNEKTVSDLKQTRTQIKNNKILVGFGISSPEDIYKIKEYCDGVIVGSLIIKELKKNAGDLKAVNELIKGLKDACG